MEFSRRYLPHVHVVDQPIFFTFRLQDSLPPGRSFFNETMTSGRAFVCMDRLLDQARTGALYLKNPAVAECVADAILQGGKSSYLLHEWVVMPNHVHLLITPRAPISSFLQKLKGSTARTANHLLGRTGLPFWQRECYDRGIQTNSDGLGAISSTILCVRGWFLLPSLTVGLVLGLTRS
jgi:hypothetical protein